MTRRPQNRRYQGYHLPGSQLLDMLEHGGVSWGLYEHSRVPGKGLVNLKLAAFGVVPRKANYWLLWTGSRIAFRKDGEDLHTRTPELAALVEASMRQCDNGHGVLSQVRGPGSGALSGDATTVIIAKRPVVAPRNASVSTAPADDGSDLI